ncbi:MAG: flagellin [Treponema sp.]|jgi:flagellin|nr:flagellin [Treponema sp.]
MIISHNLSAQFADRSLGLVQDQIVGNIEKLSSGERINRAADDASGLAVSEKLRSQIRGLNQADRNIQNGVSFIQTTEGYLQETQDILHRLRDLSVQAANGVYTEDDREQIQVEVSQLVDEVNRIASHAQFNGMILLTGTFGRESSAVMQIQVGANENQNERFYVENMNAQALGIEGLKLTSADEANGAIKTLDDALHRVSKQRADLGGVQNRLEMASGGVQIGAENLQSAESRIRDTNIAAESVLYTKNSILARTGTALLAQANMRPQAAVQLL